MTQPRPRPQTADEFNTLGIGRLPGRLGVQVTSTSDELMNGRLAVEGHHLAPNGFLHAATVIALADTLCGYGTLRSRPEGSDGFTTIEVKSNFLGTSRGGAITCEARRIHAGRTTQVWDATVIAEATGKPIALFRCTQMILWPAARPGS